MRTQEPWKSSGEQIATAATNAGMDPSILAHRAHHGHEDLNNIPKPSASFGYDQAYQPSPLSPPSQPATTVPLSLTPGPQPPTSGIPPALRSPHSFAQAPPRKPVPVAEGADLPIPVESEIPNLPIPVASEEDIYSAMDPPVHDPDAKTGYPPTPDDSNASPPAPPYSAPLSGPYATTDTTAARDFKHGPDHHSPSQQFQQSPPLHQQQFQHQQQYPSQPYAQSSSSSQPESSRSRAPSVPSSKALRKYPGLPLLDYRLYSPPLFDLNEDGTIIKSRAPHLSTSATALSALIRSLATVPPKPQVHITGNRGRKVDFKVKLNLMPLLLPEDPKRRSDYVRCVGRGESALRGAQKPDVNPEVSGGLDGWVRMFVEDPAPIRSFELERQVANLDVAWLEMQIRGMVATTAYKGELKVEFPVTHAKVIVQTPDKVNKFFTSMSKMMGSGKNRYEVIKAVWPFASHRPGEAARVCTVQSEETWWQEWMDPIRYAIATKRHGWVTNEDKLEALMEGVGKGIATVEWGVEDEVQGQPPVSEVVKA